MDPNTEMWPMVAAWFLLTAVIVLSSQRKRVPSVGLVSAYVVLLTLEHALPAALYAIPWYSGMYSSWLVKFGFRRSLYGLCAFAAAVVLIGPIWRRAALSKPSPAEVGPNTPPMERLPEIYLLIGTIGTFVLLPLSVGVSGVNAIVAGLGPLIPIGLCLVLWRAAQSSNRLAVGVWMSLVAILPFITAATKGFLGFGSVLAIIVVMFVAHTIETRTRYLILLLIAAYVALSVYVTWMHSRETIRAVAWGDSSPRSRFAVVYSTFSELRWFRLRDVEHLRAIDERQNQNFLLGAAAVRLDNGMVDYAHGSTIADAALMLIPRVVWPDKPLRAGGSSEVTKYTGIKFYGGTSISTGQTLELYINFGTAGVVVGFFCLGLLLFAMDQAAAVHLQLQDHAQFALLFAAALGWVEPGNKLLYLTVTSVSGLVAVFLVNRFAIPALASLGFIRSGQARAQYPGSFYPGTQITSQHKSQDSGELEQEHGSWPARA